MTTASVLDEAFVGEAPRPTIPPASLASEVARKHGVGKLRQISEMLRLKFGRGRLYFREYYDSGLFDPSIPFEDKLDYVGTRGSRNLNAELSHDELLTLRSLVADKVMCSSLLRQFGFAATETQAVVTTARRFGAVPALTSVEELRRFLKGKARYPLFSKPQLTCDSQLTVLLERLDGEVLEFADGRKVPLDEFCAQVVRNSADGVVFQSALRQHPEIEVITGRAVGTVRVVTIRKADMPDALYSVWKIPAPGTMSDDLRQQGALVAPVNTCTGQVGRACAGYGLSAEAIETHPVTGRAITGFQLPFWEDLRQMARNAHALFPEYGILGWDIAITESGPVIIECRDNPLHTIYQRAFGRGIRNAEFLPIFERVAAWSQMKLAQQKGRARKRRAEQ